MSHGAKSAETFCSAVEHKFQLKVSTCNSGLKHLLNQFRLINSNRLQHGNFPTLLKTDSRNCCKRTVGKHYISLFGKNSVEKGLVEAIQNNGNIKLW